VQSWSVSRNADCTNAKAGTEADTGSAVSELYGWKTVIYKALGP